MTSRPCSRCITWNYLVPLCLLFCHSSVSPLSRHRRRRSKIVRCRKNRCPSTSLSALGRTLFTPAARQARPAPGPGFSPRLSDRSTNGPTDGRPGKVVWTTGDGCVGRIAHTRGSSTALQRYKSAAEARRNRYYYLNSLAMTNNLLTRHNSEL